MIPQSIGSFLTWLMIAWTFIMLTMVYHGWAGSRKPTTHTYRGHDYPLHLPISGYEDGTLDKVLLTVEENALYQLRGNESDSVWGEEIIGQSWGYVRLGPQDRLFVVTMGHTLHCLRMLNLAFDPQEIVGMDHINHCLRYLQQMMLCAADLTLEPGDWEEKDFGRERRGATHECRNWNTVLHVLDDNYKDWTLNA